MFLETVANLSSVPRLSNSNMSRIIDYPDRFILWVLLILTGECHTGNLKNPMIAFPSVLSYHPKIIMITSFLKLMLSAC
jgi:hypothetical protein